MNANKRARTIGDFFAKRPTAQQACAKEPPAASADNPAAVSGKEDAARDRPPVAVGLEAVVELVGTKRAADPLLVQHPSAVPQHPPQGACAAAAEGVGAAEGACGGDREEGRGPAAAAGAGAAEPCSTSLEAADQLTDAQRAQIAANRNRALARRAVAAASAPGTPPLALADLLVEPSWREALGAELSSPYIRKLEAFLHSQWGPGRKAVFPPQDAIFQALNCAPFDKVRVVILGQDPYHGPGQAMGLSFSVPRDCRPLPPSLHNIYKEARADLGWAAAPTTGDLTAWSVQGVLLLNTCLTVRQGEAFSHSKQGWETFTDAAIRALSARRSGIVFLLWGKPAQAKTSLIDTKKHHVLASAHPSPLSASRGFFGCRHFSRANALLEGQGLAPIAWWPA